MNEATLPSLNDADFYSVIQSIPGPSIVFFTSAGCNSCRYWKVLLLQLLATDPTLHVYEIDAQQSMGLAREYEVFHLPALFIFMNGQYHAPLQCEARLDIIEQSIRQLLAAPAQEAP